MQDCKPVSFWFVCFLLSFLFSKLWKDVEKAMAPHSSTLAWKIPWAEEPGGLPSMGSHRVGHDWSNLAAAAAAWKDDNIFTGDLENTEQSYILFHHMLQLFFSSVQFSGSVVSDSLRPHEPQHARPPCPSPTPGLYPNSCPWSRWCHPTILFSLVPFSSCPQSFPASGSFQMSQLFASVGQSTGVSASTSVLPMNTQDWSPLGWTGWIFLQSKGLSRVFFNTTVQKHQFFCALLSL